ncbi:MAG: hypothetical protein QOI56_17, partial [Actinomycetota bacterium]|nr:hypothetical protein [Actinomycetota bacterium]
MASSRPDPDLGGGAPLSTADRGRVGSRVRARAAAMAATLPSLPSIVSGHSPYGPGQVGRKAAAFPAPRPLPTTVARGAGGEASVVRRTWALALRPPFHVWWGGNEPEPATAGRRPVDAPTGALAGAPGPGGGGGRRTPQTSAAPARAEGAAPGRGGAAADRQPSSWPRGGAVAAGTTVARRAWSGPRLGGGTGVFSVRPAVPRPGRLEVAPAPPAPAAEAPTVTAGSTGGEDAAPTAPVSPSVPPTRFRGRLAGDAAGPVTAPVPAGPPVATSSDSETSGRRSPGPGPGPGDVAPTAGAVISPDATPTARRSFGPAGADVGDTAAGTPTAAHRRSPGAGDPTATLPA